MAAVARLRSTPVPPALARRFSDRGSAAQPPTPGGHTLTHTLYPNGKHNATEKIQTLCRWAEGLRLSKKPPGFSDKRIAVCGRQTLRGFFETLKPSADGQRVSVCRKFLWNFFSISNQSAKLPFTKMGTSRPSRVVPTMERSAVPTMKSTWVTESLRPRAFSCSLSMSRPPSMQG